MHELREPLPQGRLESKLVPNKEILLYLNKPHKSSIDYMDSLLRSDNPYLVLFDISGTLMKLPGEPLPGVGNLLNALKEDGAYIGAITSAKTHQGEEYLQRAGLKSHFSFICGDDPKEGNQAVLTQALRMAQKTAKVEFDAERIFLIDDDPMRAATTSEQRISNFIVVATGRWKYESLLEYLGNIATVLRDLTDTRRVMEIIKSKSTIELKNGQKLKSKA
jgi:phosphoglycolate phosphatase-like HAD superfamily hydrolase